VGDLRTVVNKDMARNALAQDVIYREEWVLAGNALVQDATIEWSRYWLAMHWRKRQQREEQVLASNVLAEDVTIERSGYWQVMR
jgi:hypothetical protein